MLYRVYALYHLTEEFETFYPHMSASMLQHFTPKKITEEYKKVFKDDLQTLAMTSIDLVEGWDFKDEELLTVLGKSSTKDAD